MVEKRGYDPVRYRARVYVSRSPRQRLNLGTFKTREQAQAAVDEWNRDVVIPIVR